jgi:integrase
VRNRAHPLATAREMLAARRGQLTMDAEPPLLLRNPAAERFWRLFKSAQKQCAKALGDGAPPEITIHDLRHPHATLLLAHREPVKTVSERPGHASITVTLTVYGHVMPGDQKSAADRFTALIKEA